jgi:acetylornithine deacetylase
VADTDAVVPYAQKLAQRNTTTKVAFGTEAGFFSELGIPTVVCGPGSMEGQGHKPYEYITLDQLTACDQMMDRILNDISNDPI